MLPLMRRGALHTRFACRVIADCCSAICQKAELWPKPQSVAGATLRIVICRDTSSEEKIKKTGAQAEEPSLRRCYRQLTAG